MLRPNSQQLEKTPAIPLTKTTRLSTKSSKISVMILALMGFVWKAANASFIIVEKKRILKKTGSRLAWWKTFPNF